MSLRTADRPAPLSWARIATDETDKMLKLPSHGNATLHRIGIGMMIVGGVALVLPAPPADPLATAHEIFDLVATHYWWQFWGWAGVIVGNIVRLMGKQGHPGLPLPKLYGKLPAELAAPIQLRLRALKNKAEALAELARAELAATAEPVVALSRETGGTARRVSRSRRRRSSRRGLLGSL